ncbi:MAG: type II toxin-antitoxin system HicA family toxin [Proteobacteria bacterium]|nr:type II toxin-antitoxin system HicA family toxin [Pseudomonadota bacterium]
MSSLYGTFADSLCQIVFVRSLREQQHDDEVSEGSRGRHEVWKKQGFPSIPVPRHAGDIPKGTAAAILKAAGIK